MKYLFDFLIQLFSWITSGLIIALIIAVTIDTRLKDYECIKSFANELECIKNKKLKDVDKYALELKLHKMDELFRKKRFIKMSKDNDSIKKLFDTISHDIYEVMRLKNPDNIILNSDNEDLLKFLDKLDEIKLFF